MCSSWLSFLCFISNRRLPINVKCEWDRRDIFTKDPAFNAYIFITQNTEIYFIYLCFYSKTSRSPVLFFNSSFHLNIFHMCDSFIFFWSRYRIDQLLFFLFNLCFIFVLITISRNCKVRVLYYILIMMLVILINWVMLLNGYCALLILNPYTNILQLYYPIFCNLMLPNIYNR